MATVRYFLKTETTCQKCEGSGEVPAEGFRAIEFPNSKWRCGPCRGKGYIVGEQEVELASIGGEIVFVKTNSEE